MSKIDNIGGFIINNRINNTGTGGSMTSIAESAGKVVGGFVTHGATFFSAAKLAYRIENNEITKASLESRVFIEHTKTVLRRELGRVPTEREHIQRMLDTCKRVLNIEPLDMLSAMGLNDQELRSIK